MSRDGVLLLGGTGFIGSALAERLKRENIAAHIVGRNDGDLLETAIPGCGTVIHLASATTRVLQQGIQTSSAATLP
ncbi:MAG: NAD-dependent epimerase/dehydratase family protein [Propionivibrio sp.]|uniref:NAD-dependent epimerase/dehydratase family protein n=1 Tax=Propionivibrio sp. TaxID=2212460 RepID=UPI0025D8AECA|nr:NAD-dependent epimerase/dehydratase family protein [Propionivibrio sp.]MBK8894752.1 NAD-dependent epimerase/dehydratase family protein [Propionivibrio sp.]